MPSDSYLSGPSLLPLIGQTLGQNLEATVARVPDQDALIVRHQGFRATYRELWALVGRAARGLLGFGIEKGDRVGLWSPNRAEWVVLQFATARVGAILVNINPAYRASELGYVLKQSGTRTLFLARGFRQSDYRAALADLTPRPEALRETVVLDDQWESFLAKGDGVPESALAAREAKLEFDDPINIQYTSGTTGFPKGATLTHHNILNNGFFIGERLRYTAADRVCIPVPFYHCFGMVLGTLACTTHGACIVVPSEAFEPRRALEAVQAERCTALYGVPTMFIAVLAEPTLSSFDVHTLRTGIMAGSPCPVEVMKQVQSVLHMPEVSICYGMTETSPVSAQTEPDAPFEKRVSTVGTVHPHLEVKVIDAETGRILPCGSPGELCTRGYSVMRGYWTDPDATALAIDAGGWMHTGDLATVSADGYVNIVGRIKDTILRGGENIYPREVEEFLHTHPGIEEAQVIGVPSVKYGEEVMAWVRLKPGVTLTDHEVIHYCRQKIATYKIPRYVKVVESFPVTVTGKVQKFKMREQSIAELGLEAAANIKMA